MKIKIGVMGSHEKVKDITMLDRAREVGKEIARHNCIFVNGATSGMPGVAAEGAKEEEGFVMGISPARNYYEHVNIWKMPYKGYDTIIYTGFGFNLRNIVNIRTSDALVFLRGSMGTLNEFTIAYEDAKIIGILKNMGGISSFIDEILRITNKNTGATVIFEEDPKMLVRKLIEEVKKQNKNPKKLDLKG